MIKSAGIVLAALAAIALVFPAAAQELCFRVRVLRLTPAQPAMIHWRFGGEGLGGDVVSGVITREKPQAPAPGKAAPDAALDLVLDSQPKDRIVVEGDTYDTHYLNPGVWSNERTIDEFGRRPRGRMFVTFQITGHQTERAIRDCSLEFEFSYDGKPIKTFAVDGPDGPTFGVFFPFFLLDEKGRPTPEFIRQLGGLHEYVDAKLALLRAEPWIEHPTPRLYGLLTDCQGYGQGAGYGIRTTDPATMDAEIEVLRLMGLNGLRATPANLLEQMKRGEGLGLHFRRVAEGHTIGYPIPMIHVADGRKPDRHPGDGCPNHPDNLAGIDDRCRAAAESFVKEMAERRVEFAWGLTVDEIGTVFDRTPEGKPHQGCCPFCREAFRNLIRRDGLTPADFGAASWEPIRSTIGYWARDYWESHAELTRAVQAAEQQMTAAATSAGTGTGADADPDAGFTLEPDKPKKDPAKELLTARERLDVLEWKGRILEVPEAERKLEVSEQGWKLLEYYSRRFNGDAAAALFTPLAKAYDAQNRAKQAAIDAGQLDSPVAQQPWVYSFALRGNTFLMGGSSLDFFDFYRYADNGFMYETSNRDSRVWHWDSYLCDVGRSLDRFMGKRFGIYIKPHRGMPTQRALAAVARGVRAIFWYTYGPEWKKGDTFGGSPETRREVAWVSRLIAAGEVVTYDSDWALPAEIAIVRPRTSEFFSGSASWENGKWLFSALTHAHLPVDALDEQLLLEQDLSRYKVIVIAGSHLRRKVAAKLRDWVEAGGTLYTCGYGMARDEADQPLDLLYPVFGVSERDAPVEWGTVPRYGATALQPVRPERQPPEGAQVNGKAPLAGTFTPVVGREVLHPLPAAQVVATWADGSAAGLRHSFGKGTAWLIGTWAGVEYAWETMQKQPFDPAKRDWIAAPALAAGVRPVVDVGEPLVEGILLRNRQSGKFAVILINWGQPLEQPLTVRLRGAGPAAAARSLALDQPLPASPDGDLLQLTLPSLADGDIVLLD